MPSVPSWILSFLLHAVLFFVFASSLKSCGSGGTVGPGDSDVREVGIYVKQQPEPSPREENSTDDAGRTVPENAPTIEAVPTDVDDGIARLLDLPKIDTSSIVGPGASASAFVPSQPDELLKSSGVSSSIPNRSTGQGETSFFNIKARGTRFVYVLDRSGSMDSYKAILEAKRELILSLMSLEATQQFQILFYNTVTLEMKTPSGKSHLFWATDINQTLARQFIAGIHADGGTDHMPALRKAMGLNPEHIFLLTDADQPQLSPADLDEIRRLNRGVSKIHCVEFGKGPDVPVQNFLKRLAQQNGGSYRYCDVTEFTRPRSH